MPENIFSINNIQFLHVHPGYLPDMRGADCLLWSLILTGNPSATSFFMDPGIDTGNIIKANFFPKIRLPKDVLNLETKMIYRLIYSFIDPWIRAAALRNTIKFTEYFEKTLVSTQDKKKGKNFHFMHEKIINEVIKILTNSCQ